MKSKNKIRHFLLASSLLAASLPALALTGDTEQPVKVDSAKQALDMAANTITFTDNVIIKQGTIEIKADKVVVTRRVVIRAKWSLKVLVIRSLSIRCKTVVSP